MKKILMIFAAIVTFASCEKCNEDPYNYMTGGTWTAQRVEVQAINDIGDTILETYSLEDKGLTALVLNLYKIERNNPITTNGLGDISEYAFGQFGWSINDIEADSAIFAFRSYPYPVLPFNVNSLSDLFMVDAVYCATCGDMFENTIVHIRSKNEMAMLMNKGWVVYSR
jgi:hypothetical protein